MAKLAANGALSAVLVRDFGRVITILSENCFTLTRTGTRGIIAAVIEVKKEIPAESQLFSSPSQLNSSTSGPYILSPLRRAVSAR